MLGIDGAATLGFAGFGLETNLKHLAGLGFKKVELSHMGEYCRHYRYRQGQADEVKDLLGKYGLTVVSMNASTCRIVEVRAVYRGVRLPRGRYAGRKTVSI